MARIGIVIVLAAVIGSMGAAIYTFTEYQTNVIETVAGEKVKVGPVEYIITFEGTHKGDKEDQPENIFVKIGITAENISNEKTLLSGKQFYFVDEIQQKHEAVYGEFSAKDLLLEGLEPGEPIERTVQFDVPFDEEKQYKIIVRPEKDQSSQDVAMICITNC
ncbi:DUF4352 domain-containing protein [Nitrosopumilus sp.]|uniref:DUF4352 domain-containing protein n=1 Tax=Nitrosopumilus sp. TaxID=2024843 RepID=UPI002930678F|nr:DUF4352 domain-containing protein [Nitrosopumilus sp.]